MLGVPTKDPLVLIVILSLIVWNQMLQSGRSAQAFPQFGRWVWAGTIAMALAFASGTALAAFDELRVPHRAIRFGWPYYVGYHQLETPRETLSFRWTEQHALAAFAAPRGYLRLTYWVRHADVAENPVTVEFRRDHELVVREQLRDKQARTVYLLLRSLRGGVVIESNVSRPYTPGGRELGVAIRDWEVVAKPPSDARVIN